MVDYAREFSRSKANVDYLGLLRAKYEANPLSIYGLSAFVLSRIDKTKADTSVAVAVLVRNPRIDAKRRSSK